MKGARERGREGFVLMGVLVVLLALLVLCAPFLMGARNADRASSQSADRAQARMALDSAARHARARLVVSHAALDSSPWWDSLEELSVSNRFDEAFLDANDAEGVMWDLEAEDAAGRVDVNSAGPQVIANLTGLVTRLTRVLEPGDEVIPVASTAGFEPTGELWIDGEFVTYGALEPGAFLDCERGVGVTLVEEGGEAAWQTDGPSPPDRYGVGTPVFDRRVFAPIRWRTASADGDLRTFAAFDELAEAAPLPPAGGDLSRALSVHAGVRGGARWQRPTRLVAPVAAGVDLALQLEDTRWFTPGATLRIRDGDSSELAVVSRRPSAAGEVVIDRVLSNDYDAWTSVVEVLARRPVNVNTAGATVLEALFRGLALRDRNSRITDAEARELTALVIASRPFEGLEDFLRRAVLPVAGLEPLPEDAPRVPELLSQGGVATLIDEADALALYLNCLNANDELLAFATMPIAFTSRDVHEMELRASVNAPSGVERVSAVREHVELIAPQRELFYLWSRQDDFEEALRLGRQAPWWASGPHATHRFDGTTVPPSRRAAHFGPSPASALPFGAALASEESAVERVFGSREADGYVKLAPSREIETPVTAGRVLHFDEETRSPEGRYLPDETVLLPSDDPLVQWNDRGSYERQLLRGLSFSAWIQPRSVADGVLLDVGATSLETDRVRLAIEGGELTLRVFDAFGDHSGSALEEIGVLRYSVASGAGDPGLPTDVWSHVSVDVRGNRPDQMTMLVNGQSFGVRTPGLTRLTSNAPQGAGLIGVESTEGFPDVGVVRIGNELTEYEKAGPNTLRARHYDTGELAGFGGRIARELQDAATGVPANLGSIQTSHAPGTPVQLYGYSLPLASDLPAGGSALPSTLGLWRAARLMEVIGGDEARGDRITVGGVSALGLDGDSVATMLVLAPGDDPSQTGDTSFMGAFNETGGYAALVGKQWGVGTLRRADSNADLGGIEIVRYSGYDAATRTLRLAARGATLTELAHVPTQPGPLIGGSRAFVGDWELNREAVTGVLLAQRMDWATYVLPISLPVPGASPPLTGFLAPAPGRSEIAQITRPNQAERTEWVRYDEIAGSQLVRDHPTALEAVHAVLSPGLGNADQDPGGPGGGAGPLSLAVGPPPLQDAPQGDEGVPSQWTATLGEAEDDDFPLTRAASRALRFRGVLGTFAHAHPAGVAVVPVFRATDLGVDGGRPGRLDDVFLSDAAPTSLGWPLRVHRAHSAWETTPQAGWTQSGAAAAAAAAGSPINERAEGRLWLDVLHVAFQTPSPAPIPAGAPSGTPGPGAVVDARLLARITKFPSGERPRAATTMALGTDFRGTGTLGVPSAVIDEVVFGTPSFGRAAQGTAGEYAAQAGQLVLAASVSAADTQLVVEPTIVRVPLGRIRTAASQVAALSDTGGLLRIGQEILAYESRDPGTSTLVVAVAGRGLLGTQAQPHERTEPLAWLEHLTSGVLLAPLSADDGTLAVSGVDRFPPMGTVLVGDELLHYTRVRAGALEMPRASSVPGEMDEKGPGLFRGRFGTSASDHAAGTPVILFPFRYWDRWSERADAPELAYFELRFDQPGAWWSDVFFDWDRSLSGAVQLGVLQRADPSVPWDADPSLEEGLEVLWEGTLEGAPVPIASQSDSVEWRVFARYLPGAFDPAGGQGHGWKEAPHFRRLGVDFLAPSRVLWSADR